MSVLFYPLAAVLVVIVASTVMWARTRKPTSIESGVEAFRQEMEAISPERERQPGHHPGGTSRLVSALHRPPRER